MTVEVSSHIVPLARRLLVRRHQDEPPEFWLITDREHRERLADIQVDLNSARAVAALMARWPSPVEVFIALLEGRDPWHLAAPLPPPAFASYADYLAAYQETYAELERDKESRLPAAPRNARDTRFDSRFYPP